MNKEKMVLYLGYAALVLIGLYFTVGILKISGEGLAKLGYPNNFIREGFSDKQKEEKLKYIKRGNEQMKGAEKWMDKFSCSICFKAIARSSSITS